MTNRSSAASRQALCQSATCSAVIVAVGVVIASVVVVVCLALVLPAARTSADSDAVCSYHALAARLTYTRIRLQPAAVAANITTHLTMSLPPRAVSSPTRR